MTLKIPKYKFDLNAPEFQRSDDEFLIWFLEGVLEKYPSYIDALLYLGNAYTAEGMYAEGLKVDLKLVKLKPGDPFVHYNLACSYSLLGKIDESLGSLNTAVGHGYDDLEYLENDCDLDSVRDEDGYDILIDKMKKSAKGVIEQDSTG